MIERPGHAHTLYPRYQPECSVCQSFSSFVSPIMIEGLTDADRSLDTLLKDLAKYWYKVTNYLPRIVQVEVHTQFDVIKISNTQIFIVVFAHRGLIQNVHKFALYENFPSYGNYICIVV